MTAAPPPERTWSILELLRWTTEHFGARGIETARLDAEVLLAHVLDVDRLRLYVDFEATVAASDRAAYRAPVAQLVGKKEFWSLSLKVTPDVLVPRPDTETLVTAALDLLPDREAEARVLDVGTGSGAVALAIALERPRAHLVGTDISQAALEIARENADVHGVGDRIRWALGHLFQPVAGRRFDLVVSNPPYVAESQRHEMPAELAHEPEEALFSGRDGTVVLAALIAGVNDVLEPGGAVAVELAPEQAPRVADWCREAGLVEVTTARDLGRRPRVVAARRPVG
jgi:release factor glutamine methyltransferase